MFKEIIINLTYMSLKAINSQLLQEKSFKNLKVSFILIIRVIYNN